MRTLSAVNYIEHLTGAKEKIFKKVEAGKHQKYSHPLVCFRTSRERVSPRMVSPWVSPTASPSSISGGRRTPFTGISRIQDDWFKSRYIRFESVEKTLSEERTKIAGQRAGEKEDSNKQSTQTLTIRSQLSIIINNYQLAFACHEL